MGRDRRPRRRGAPRRRHVLRCADRAVVGADQRDGRRHDLLRPRGDRGGRPRARAGPDVLGAADGQPRRLRRAGVVRLLRHQHDRRLRGRHDGERRRAVGGGVPPRHRRRRADGGGPGRQRLRRDHPGAARRASPSSSASTPSRCTTSPRSRRWRCCTSPSSSARRSRPAPAELPSQSTTMPPRTMGEPGRRRPGPARLARGARRGRRGLHRPVRHRRRARLGRLPGGHPVRRRRRP